MLCMKLCSVKKLVRLWHFDNVLTYNFWISWREGTTITLNFLAILHQGTNRAILTRKFDNGSDFAILSNDVAKVLQICFNFYFTYSNLRLWYIKYVCISIVPHELLWTLKMHRCCWENKLSFFLSFFLVFRNIWIDLNYQDNKAKWLENSIRWCGLGSLTITTDRKFSSLPVRQLLQKLLLAWWDFTNFLKFFTIFALMLLGHQIRKRPISPSLPIALKFVYLLWYCVKNKSTKDAG